MRNVIILFCLLSFSTLANAGVIRVSSQEHFDRIDQDIKMALSEGDMNIDVVIAAGLYSFNNRHISLMNLNYPNATIRIIGDNASLIEKGVDMLSIKTQWSETYLCKEPIEVVDASKKICRLKHSGDKVPDGVRRIQVTEWYLAPIYEVDKIEDGYIYFTASDLGYNKTYKCYNVNLDYGYGQKNPRYKLSSTEGKILGYSGSFFYAENSYFESVTIKGLKFGGNTGNQPLIGYTKASANNFVIRNCIFSNIQTKVVDINLTPNVTITNCSFSNCAKCCIYIANGSKYIKVSNNRFVNNCYKLSNTHVITAIGENFQINNNYIQDFTYTAIAIGMWYGHQKDYPCTGIVENNEISFSKEYFNNAWKYTLMDAGAIYTFTQMDNVTIRNNYIHDYNGYKDYRGIFCDDGSKNVKILGNVISNIPDSYDIDLRLCPSLANHVPDYNTGNVMTDNVITGTYRFQGRVGMPDSAIDSGNITAENVTVVRGKLKISKNQRKAIKKSGDYKKIKKYLKF